VFKNRVLREIFGAVRIEVTGDWRRLHNEELRGLYCSPNVITVSESSVKKNRQPNRLPQRCAVSVSKGHDGRPDYALSCFSPVTPGKFMNTMPLG